MPDSVVWFEIGLNPGEDPCPVYRLFSDNQDLGVQRVHHFRDEPWHPGAVVIRAEVDSEAEARFRSRMCEENVAYVGRWDGEEADRELYGDYFDFAMQFFQASSVFTCKGEHRPWFTKKLIHCVLNAHDEGDIKWAAKYIIARIKTNIWVLGRQIRGGEWWK